MVVVAGNTDDVVNDGVAMKATVVTMVTMNGHTHNGVVAKAGCRWQRMHLGELLLVVVVWLESRRKSRVIY